MTAMGKVDTSNLNTYSWLHETDEYRLQCGSLKIVIERFMNLSSTDSSLHSVTICYFILFHFQEFDAFVSYCHEDNEWVRQELQPRLEDCHPLFRLCLHERDFVAGAAVADNISAAISTSRRMVLLLSRAFLRSHWCYMEFRQAHYKVNRGVLLFVWNLFATVRIHCYICKPNNFMTLFQYPFL